MYFEIRPGLLFTTAGERCDKARDILVIKTTIAIHVEHDVKVHVRKLGLVCCWIGQRQNKQSDVIVAQKSIVISIAQSEKT